MRVALAGGTGFTGRRVAARLVGRGHAVGCLVRAGSDRSVLPPGVECAVGDLSDAPAVRAWLDGFEGLVYCSSMGFGHAPGVVAAAEAAGIRRAVFLSTTAIFTKLQAKSRAPRVAAEECVRASRLAWTILRPTMIYGAPGDRNMERLLRSVARWPVVFVPGSGRALIQPVHVDDLADAVVAAFESFAAEGRAYDISGRSPLAFDAAIDAAIDAVAAAVGKRRTKIHLPLGPVAGTLSLLEKLRLPLPVKSEQVRRLAEDKAFPHDDARRDFGYQPRDFATGIAEEARELGLVQS